MCTVFVGHNMNRSRIYSVTTYYTSNNWLVCFGELLDTYDQLDGCIRVLGLGQPRYRCVHLSVNLQKTVKDTVDTMTTIYSCEDWSTRRLPPFATWKMFPLNPRNRITTDTFEAFDSEQTHTELFPFCGDAKDTTDSCGEPKCHRSRTLF